MARKFTFASYCIMNAFIMILILVGWVAGSHGKLFTNVFESTGIVLALLLLFVLPFLILKGKNSNHSNNSLRITAITLLTLQLSILAYFTYLWSNSSIDLGAMLIGLAFFTTLLQLVFSLKKQSF